MTTHDRTPGSRPAPAAFRRPVSATEWLYLGAHRLGRAMVLQLVVEGDGALHPDELRTAVAVAAESCPGSRLVRHGRTWIDSGRPPQVRVAEEGSGPDAELRSGTSLLEDPLNLLRGPGCEVLLLPRTAAGPAALVFRAFHGVMDGHGAQLWMGEVFRALRGEAPRPAPSPLTDARLLAEVGATGRRPALLLDQPSPLAAPAARPTGAERPAALWRRCTLPGRHPSLTARLAQAVADATGAPRARVMVPVDLRRHHKGPPATGNLALPVFLDLGAGESWHSARSQLLLALTRRRELSDGFESALARLPLPATALLLRAGQAMALRHDRYMASAIVSHLGRISPADCSGGGFTARSVYALPVHAPLVPVSCVAVELPDRTELTVGFQGGTGLAQRADELMDRLVTAVAGPGPAEPARPACTAPSAPSAPSGPQPEAAEAVEAADMAGATVVRLLRRQAARTPHATVLDGPAGPVGYAELDRRSDAVAAELLRCGVSREDVVGLLVERSPAGVAGLWGILKAGAAYLPLDPNQPDARIAQVLRESGSAFCVTERHLLNRSAGVSPCPVLAAEDVPEAPADVRLPDPDPEQLAYVIFTSGSTGRPKGVQIEHRSLLAFARWAARLCQVDERTRFAFLSSFSFDISCFPLFLPLLHGGTTVLVPGEPTRPVLRDLLDRHRADTLAVTPTHLDLIEHYGLDLSGLRTLLVGGEQFTRSAAERARLRLGPDGRIVNAYGPTEATVGCLAHVLDGTEAGPVVPIGHPAPSVRVELVGGGGGGEPIGPEQTGAVGEILLSGLQLARGYLDRPDLDADSFPVGADGVRRYRTGDLGRRLPGGAMEFVGRNDDQLKIAGHRIEPAEVRTALEGHPAVRTAVVAVRTRPGGGAALCAYVLAADGDGAAPELGAALREHLAERLPAHLVPAVVLPIAALPRTVGGKADLAALPDPFAALPDPSAARASADAEPTVDAEPTAGGDVVERLAVLWSRTLGIDRRLIDVHSDFQQLGGDSLAVLEMLSVVAEELLGPAEVDGFMADIGGVSAELTLGRVCDAVRRARRDTGRAPAAGTPEASA
ncbi:non-ribosomal peptide synthetase [Kitasatospora sp. GP82]|uniref:non-ribosomal peptide synthetase n=1 Tax=Kitasatospora sp. GP82 TaxID=3035089 RepID=UPI002473D545|nr:non-ribosomal peptide synthetase [Kitasatospora sp. GP82]MDH6125841.1 amino acid adenylation domain-containing protein [Kitasatospora sp. GP82]